ncbi:MAG: N-acetylglucosamine-6-phosphate deacetylase [Mycolicibacterium sp.]|uniref:N-acetylglucosamine-6-phosphate deacetylase n=1 Tax=Mycolicibacterium sp. TaxID=2320850 RepID=UPI003D11A8EE
MLITAATVATGWELLQPGWIEISGTTVLRSGAGPPPGPTDVDLGPAIVVPGFVDTHVHGGGGANFCAATQAQTAAAVQFHRRFGTTTLIASLVSASPAELLRQVTDLAEEVRAGLIAGVHLEGPWLAPTRCGAHDVSLLRDPSPEELDAVLSAGGGAIRMITLAPERTGALAAIGRIVDAGAVAAVGHTDATYEQTRAAIGAGATVATHLFNAMRSIHQREPGPVIALLEDPAVTAELIADGVHVAPPLYRHISASVGAERVSLVTDAIAAAGMPDGGYRLGRLAVDVVDGMACVAGTDTIAGSTATMDTLFRFSVAHSGLPADDALLLAVRQSSINPAAALGIPGVGLTAGAKADLVVLGSNLAVEAVMYAGAWVPSWAAA